MFIDFPLVFCGRQRLSRAMFCCGSSRNVEEPLRLKEARDWGTGGGQRLGGVASEPGAALRAAERRQNAAGDTELRQKEELLGRLTEQYQRLGEEMPMGLKPPGYGDLWSLMSSVRA